MALEQTTSIKEAVQSTKDEVRVVRSEVAQIAAELRTLVQMEGELARAEVDEARGHAVRGSGMGAGALLLGQVTAVFVFLTLMFALDEYVLPLWAAALVTTLLAAAIVGLLIALAMSEFKAFSPVPRRFLRSLTEDLQWAKTQFRSNVR